ncbi:bifunctional DNA primase/polymerase [Streptomyces microflavus]|uniref:bifunctional DNA primase/polymerase n=1 Tax=Streptomyces microflavus TaxID=1919 RepID=UPI0033B181A8
MPLETCPPEPTTRHPHPPANLSVRFARWCADQGWPVLLLAPGRKTPAANCQECRSPRHERPTCGYLSQERWCHGFHAATQSAGLTTQWWGRPGLGVGVGCGPARLVVVDIDVRPVELPERNRLLPGIRIGERINLTGVRTGFHTLAVHAALRGAPSPADDASTLRVRTPTGGMHVWYRATDGRTWLCSTRSGSRRALAWPVDVQAHGGYIVAPGTTTRSGTYARVGIAVRPAPIPSWLSCELERTGHLQAPGAPASAPPRDNRSALPRSVSHTATGRGRGAAGRAVLAPPLAKVAACAVASEDANFTEKLNRAAYNLGGLAAGEHLAAAEAEAALRACALATRPGRSGRIASVIRSGVVSGNASPMRLGEAA